MTCNRLLTQMIEALRRGGRVSYRALKRRFPPGEATPGDLKTAISQAKKLTRGMRSPGLVRVEAPLMTPVQDWGPTPHSYTPPHLAHTILTGRSALAGERKHVTVLFADLQDSTALAQAVDPEVLHDVLDGVFELMLTEVHRVEGTINQCTGDGIREAQRLVRWHYQRRYTSGENRCRIQGVVVVGGAMARS
jgi:hypothetical protein